MKKNRRIFCIIGIILILTGILIVFLPNSPRVILGIVFGISFTVSGVSSIIATFVDKNLPFPGLTMAAGILNLIIGIFLLCFHGDALQTIFIIAVAIRALIRWALLFTDAFQERKAQHGYRRLDLVLGIGLLVLAGFMIISPFGGQRITKIITILFGLAVLAEGISMFIFSRKVKNIKEITINLE